MKRFYRAMPDSNETAPCKRCAKCRERKTLDNFFLCKPKNSTPFYYYLCHGCKNERQRELSKVRPTKPVVKKKKTSYVAKVWPIAGETPAKVAAKFLDSEFVVPKAILREDGRYFMASANGRLPARYELLGIFNCNMPYRDLVRELAA